jgi:hypothetical protein
MTAIEYVERPPAGWFALDVMRTRSRKWDWVALMVDIDPDDLKNCACDFPALFLYTPTTIGRGNASRISFGFASKASTEAGTPRAMLSMK